MDFIGNFCMNCFREMDDENVCSKCGFDKRTYEQKALYLPLKTVLVDRYVVGKVISCESDAITYSGYDLECKNVVTIREFMPSGIANRLEGNPEIHVREKFKKNFLNYKDSFVNLWKTLKSLNNLSAVIPVLDVFEANGTEYAVCEKMETLTLREFLLRTQTNNILWDKARLMFMPVLTTIENLHKNGIIHGGINPDNLVLCRDGKVRLDGFCINECNTASTELEFNNTDGYTALEQYNNNHKICPATDIYAFSACIYRALVGTNPPSALSREINDKLMIPNRIAEKIPPYVIKALGGGLQIYPENRIQNINDFREFLNASPSVVAKAASGVMTKNKEVEKEVVKQVPKEQTYKEFAEKEKKAKNKKIAIIVSIVVAVMIIVGAGVGVYEFVNRETTVPQTVAQSIPVPDFCTAGYTKSDVESSAAWNKSFKIQFNYENSADVPQGVVFKQSIEAGQTAQEGSPITLTVSKGVEMATIPDVGGLPKDEAIKKLKELGFTVSVVTVYNNTSHTPDTVKAADGIAPGSGLSVPKGSEVVIQVYGEEVTEPVTQEQTTVALDY